MPLFLDALVEARQSHPQFDIQESLQRNATDVDEVSGVDPLPSTYDDIGLHCASWWS